jgi:hypothetical protein
MYETTMILDHQFDFLKFLRDRFPVFHMSNIFFRDLHYGVLAYLAHHGKRISYRTGEKIAMEVANSFENSGIFKRINHRTWVLNYPEFSLPRPEKKTA